MWLIATTVTLFRANVRVMADQVKISDRNPTENCGNLQCGLWFCMRSAANLASSPSLVSLCDKEN